jgi:hypothetical protein
MTRCLRQIEMDGLLWGASGLEEVGYGIKKLRITVRLVHQYTFDAVYVCVLPWSEFPIVSSYPHYPHLATQQTA